MLHLYNHISLLSTPSSEDIEQLASQHDSVMKAISHYYEYLEKTGTPVEESYLTHWLDKGYFPDYYHEIEAFLMD